MLRPRRIISATRLPLRLHRSPPSSLPHSLNHSVTHSLTRGLNTTLHKLLPDEDTSGSHTNPATMVAPVILSHGALGMLLSFPVIGEALSREVGVVSSAAGDWDIIETTLPLSMGFMISGLISSFFGDGIAQLGPRKALMGSAVAIGGGLAVSALGVYTHALPLLYFGFGTTVAAGAGLCYVSPIQTLMSWFPQNKGMCGGIAVSAMGLGAVLSKEGLEMVLKSSAKLPEYIGPSSSFDIIVGKGKDIAVEVGGVQSEVVQVLSSQVANSLPTLQEGLYLVGSGGSTGAAEALGIMSAITFSTLAASSLLIRTPPKDYNEDKSDLFLSPLFSELTARDSKDIEPEKTDPVDFFTAVRSRNFHVLGAMLACTATSGLGLMALAEPIMMEEYSRTFPDLITPTFMDNHLLCLGAAGIFGAGFWSSLSDFVGSRKALVLMYFISSPAILALPFCTSLAADSGSTLPVFLSVGAGAVAVSSLGGVMATMPAYCSELYGTKNVTAIQGGLLAYTTVAATIAPYLYVKLHSLAENAAVAELLQKVSPDDFQAKFASSISEVSSLLQSGTLTLADLHSIAPAGTLDPSVHLYDTTLYTFAGLMTLSALSNSLIQEPLKNQIGSGANFSPHVPLPEKVRRNGDAATSAGGKQFTDRRKKKK